MPVTIGAKRESDFTDPVGMLSDCHRRIERFLGVLVTVADEAQGGSLSPEQRSGLDNALKYFRESAPKHADDEEESLFPRLQATDPEAARQLLKNIEVLELDHDRAQCLQTVVDDLGRLWLQENALSLAQMQHLEDALDELAALYQAHIEIEENEIFPMAESLLTAAGKHAIGVEMAERRGLDPSRLPNL